MPFIIHIKQFDKKYFDLIPSFGHKVYDKWQKEKEGYIWLNYKWKHLEDQFEGIDVGLFPSSASKSVTVNSFNARRALERIGQSDPGKMYQVMALSSIKQTAIPMHGLHADTTTISFYGNIARKSRRLPGMLF